MKQYTIVYVDMWMSGSHQHSITRYDRVKTDDLKKTIAQDKYAGAVCFVFEGWPLEEGEKKVLKNKPRKKVSGRCPDCGLPSGDAGRYVFDEDLNK